MCSEDLKVSDRVEAGYIALMALSDSRWNLNIHYHREVLDAIPTGSRTALDVGCGDGLLAFDLADRDLDVTAIDLDEPIIARARHDERAAGRITFVVGDFLTHSLPANSFDIVGSIATLHHMDARAAIVRMKELVRPSGVVAIVGFARSSTLTDRVLAVSGGIFKRTRVLRGRYWEHHAPIAWPPPLTLTEMEQLTATELPGCRFKRLLSNRYSVVWHAPIETA